MIAEDLGLITPEVDELRERFGMPGMRILQFGFSDRGAHLYLPHQFVPNTVVYTGTHDNNTTLGWWRDGATQTERANVQTYLRPIEHDGEIVWAMETAPPPALSPTSASFRCRTSFTSAATACPWPHPPARTVTGPGALRPRRPPPRSLHPARRAHGNDRPRRLHRPQARLSVRAIATCVHLGLPHSCAGVSTRMGGIKTRDKLNTTTTQASPNASLRRSHPHHELRRRYLRYPPPHPRGPAFAHRRGAPARLRTHQGR